MPERTCTEQKHAGMIDRTRVCQFKVGMRFVDLCKVCLQKTASYTAPKHGKENLPNISRQSQSCVTIVS